MAKQNGITFKWSNYLKATPANLQYLSDGLKAIVATIAVTSYAQDNVKLGFWLLVLGAVLDVISKFFARVQRETEVTITAKLPAEVNPEEVQINTEVKDQ